MQLMAIETFVSEFQMLLTWARTLRSCVYVCFLRGICLALCTSLTKCLKFTVWFWWHQDTLCMIRSQCTELIILGRKLRSGKVFQNKGTCTSLARLSFLLKVPLCSLHSSIINFIPCNHTVKRAYTICF